MSLIVKNVTRLITEFIAIFGAYIIVYGHVTPGGGFAGGVILASGLALIVLAFGRTFTRQIITHDAAVTWDCTGALGFLAIAVLGYLGGYFFLNFIAHRAVDVGKLLSAGSIPLSNVAIGIKVGAALYGVFIALIAFHREEEARRLGRPLE